jgi:hypothetical protein
MKCLKILLSTIITDSIKAVFLMLVTVSVANANSFDTNTKYFSGDIISVDGEFQAEALKNTEDSIEIGLINQENQRVAMAIWDLKEKYGYVVLNLDTEDEKIVPIQIAEQMNLDRRMEALADGLFVMESQTEESNLSEQVDMELDATDADMLTKRASSVSANAVSTKGEMIPSDTTLVTGVHGESLYEGPLRDGSATRKLNGFAIYNLPNPNADFVWVRFLAYDYSANKWEQIGWELANGPAPSHGFSFTIPDQYDMDLNDLDTASVNDISTEDVPVDHQVVTTTYTRKFAADAWSAPGVRTNFATAVVSVKQADSRQTPSR